MSEEPGGVNVYGLIRVRNESRIILETLDHMAEFCTGGICVYDDASTDDTAALCERHPAVLKVVRGAHWSPNRAEAEYQNRAEVLAAVQEVASAKDWLVYIDADERVEFDWSSLERIPEDVVGVRMRLFDFYITSEDADKSYRERLWLGPEYRSILTLFRNLPTLSYHSPDQREVDLGVKGRVLEAGYLRHYGKAESVEQWEETCSYYEKHFPLYADKWKRRHGKAIHRVSDFGFPLIRWEQKDLCGLPMTAAIGEMESRDQLSEICRPLSILIATHHMTDYTGTETYTLTLARALAKRGHAVTVYARYMDRMRPYLVEAGIPAVDDLNTLRGQRFDVAHVHHSLPAVAVRVAFPALPMVMVSHGVLPFLEQHPPLELGAARILAVSEEVRDHLIALGVSAADVYICRNLVDEGQFTPVVPPASELKRAAILSGRMDESTASTIRAACQKLGIKLQARGGKGTELTPRRIPVFLNSVDLVFTLGRGAIETMLCGRVPVVMDCHGCDGMVMPGNLQDLMACNFSGRRFARRPTVDELAEELKTYTPGLGLALRDVALRFFAASEVVRELEQHYLAAIVSPKIVLSKHSTRLLDFVSSALTETRNYTFAQATRLAVREGGPPGVRAAPETAVSTPTPSRLPDALLVPPEPGESGRGPACPVCAGATLPAVRKRDHVYFKCQNCGALFTPHIDPSILLAEQEPQGEGGDESSDTLRLGRIEAELGSRPCRMIDYGCGGGRFVRSLMQRGISAGGVDRHTLLQLDNLADGAWDVVSLIGQIEHIIEPHGIFQALARILRPGGLVYLESNFVADQNLLTWDYLDPAFGRSLVYSPASLAKLAERHEFELAKVEDGAYVLRKSGDFKSPAAPALHHKPGRGQPPRSLDASIIIPAYNQADLTLQCLERVFASLPTGKNVEVIVVDNASSDETPHVLRDLAQRHPALRVIRNEHNLLFARACNQGAAAARGDVLVFLNNDTEPKSGWLEAGLRALEDDKGIGAVGGRLLYPDGTLQHAGIEFVPEGQPGYRWWPQHRHLGIQGNDPRVAHPEDVVAVTGACLLVRRSDFETIEGFDESYIMYFEDLDLCFKLRRAGLRIVYEPEMVVVHHEGQSSPGRKAIDDLNRAAACLFFHRWGTAVDRVAAALTPAAFLYEPDWTSVEWVEVVLSYLEAFQPGEPVALILPLDTERPGALGLEAAEARLVELVVQTGRTQFPDIILTDKPGELLELMRKYTQFQWVPRERENMHRLKGENGVRFLQARARLTAPE